MGKGSGHSRSWLLVFGVLEGGAVLMSFSAMRGSLRIPNASNRIARLVLDDPNGLESFVFYFIAAHILIGPILMAAWLETRRAQTSNT